MAEHAQTAESMTTRTANGSEVKVQLPPSESTSVTGSHLALTVDQSTAENSPCRLQLQETSEAFLQTRTCGDRSKTLPSQEDRGQRSARPVPLHNCQLTPRSNVRDMKPSKWRLSRCVMSWKQSRSRVPVQRGGSERITGRMLSPKSADAAFQFMLQSARNAPIPPHSAPLKPLSAKTSTNQSSCTNH